MDEQGRKNVEILIPHRNEKAIPDYLEDFIQNDPNFVPEIHNNNLEDAFMNLHNNYNPGNQNLMKNNYLAYNDRVKDYDGSNSSLSTNAKVAWYKRWFLHASQNNSMIEEGPNHADLRIDFKSQYYIMLRLKVRIMWTEKRIVFTVIVLSWLLFFVILLCFIEGAIKSKKVSIKTVDIAYKALENFIFLSIAGVFLFSQIEDHTS